MKITTLLARTHSLVAFALIFVSLILFAFPKESFSKEEGTVEETTSPPLIITGSALSQTIDSLPASASVLNREQLTETGASYFQEQIIRLPNVNYAGGTSRPRFFQIRGIGELEQYEGAPNSSVALIVDDVDLTGIGAALTLFDIHQLEVHRGPQPTRFGSSALAGAINIITEAPTEEVTGHSLFSVGNDELVSGGFAASGALTDNLSLRATAFGHRQDGFRDNEFLSTDDTNEREEFTGRMKFLLTPTDSSQFTLTLTNVDINNGYDAFNIFNGFTNQSDRPGVDEERLRLASLQGKIELTDSLDLSTTTSIYKSEVDYSFDGDWGNNPFWAPFDPYDFFSDTDRERTTFAQQVRLTGDAPALGESSRFLVGAFFQSLEEDTNTREFSDDIIFDRLDSDYQQDTYAGFTSVDIPLAEDLSLIIGARGEYRDSRYKDNRDSFFVPDDFLWGGDVTLQYDWDPDVTTYVLASRGFRGEGFNSNPSLPQDLLEYDSEALYNFELGTRFTLLDGDLRGAVATFYNVRRDQQIKLALQVDPNDPLSFTFLTDNAARGEGAGLEVELEYFPLEQLALRSTGSLLHTEIKSVDNDSLSFLEGRDQSHAPNWQYFVESEYFFTEQVSSAVGVAGRDAFFFDDSNNERSGVYHLLHAAIRYATKSWKLEFWGRNLTDEKYAVRGFFFGNEPPDFPETQYTQLGDPRSFGATFTLSFDELFQ